MKNVNDVNESSIQFEVGRPENTTSGVKLLKLSGHMDADGAPRLSELLNKLLESGARQVHLDFQDVKFISSTGIGTLIAAISEFRDVGGDVSLKNLSPELIEVFEMLGLMDFLTLI